MHSETNIFCIFFSSKLPQSLIEPTYSNMKRTFLKPLFNQIFRHLLGGWILQKSIAHIETNSTYPLVAPLHSTGGHVQVSKNWTNERFQIFDLINPSSGPVSKNFFYKFCHIHVLLICIIKGATFVWILKPLQIIKISKICTWQKCCKSCLP